VDHLEILDIHLPRTSLAQPVLSVWRTDAPVNVALLGPDGAEQGRWHGRDVRVVLEQGRAMIRVSGPLTRYTLRLGLELDRSKPPGPYQEVDLSPLPIGGDPWPEEGELHGWERYFQILVDEEIAGTPGLQLSGPPGLTLHLLDELGTPVTGAERVGDGELRLDLAGVAPGGYVLRIGRTWTPPRGWRRAGCPPRRSGSARCCSNHRLGRRPHVLLSVATSLDG
jgi:hypothetical protein